jgi:hypothetical protein
MRNPSPAGWKKITGIPQEANQAVILRFCEGMQQVLAEAL